MWPTPVGGLQKNETKCRLGRMLWDLFWMCYKPNGFGVDDLGQEYVILRIATSSIHRMSVRSRWTYTFSSGTLYKRQWPQCDPNWVFVFKLDRNLCLESWFGILVRSLSLASWFGILDGSAGLESGFGHLVRELSSFLLFLKSCLLRNGGIPNILHLTRHIPNISHINFIIARAGRT